MELHLSKDDDSAFANRVSVLIAGASKADGLRSIRIMKVDNWFGRRWLGFSHKALGAVGVHRVGPALRVPPFKPSRILSEQRWEPTTSGSWERADSQGRVHVEQSSTENERRLVRELFPQTALYWWSGRTRSNGKGALMAYLPGERDHFGWYVEISRNGSWRDTDLLCITASELESFTRLGEPAN